MGTSFVGEIMLWPGSFVPEGWLACDGSLLSIAGDYEVLYAVLGTTYGGDGQSTFQVPDLRGSVPVHQGTAATGTVYPLGTVGGSETVALTASQLPGHRHPLLAANLAGDTDVPKVGVALSGLGPVQINSNAAAYAAPGGPQVALAGTSVGIAGGGQAHGNLQPSLAISFIICWSGVYPSQ